MGETGKMLKLEDNYQIPLTYIEGLQMDSLQLQPLYDAPQ